MLFSTSLKIAEIALSFIMHSQSSYGIPVVIDSLTGIAYGQDDLLPPAPDAMRASDWAKLGLMYGHFRDEQTALAQRFLGEI